MADSPVYTTVPGKIPDLLLKIRESGIPSKVNHDWLKSLGFKSSNDRSLLPVLRQIGFVDASQSPTPAWKQYRGSDHRAVLGRAVQVGYADLFRTYPNAQERPKSDIAHVFSTRSSAGKQSVDKMVPTFFNLAALAEFPKGSETPAVSYDVARPSRNGGMTDQESRPFTDRRDSPDLAVNITIVLTLPDTENEEVFAAFFKAMREYLLEDSGA